jgi:hypothetical protein
MTGEGEVQWTSPDKNHVAKWRWGGELWMSGPEWGWLAIGEGLEIKGALPEVLWSDDGAFLAFVKLHIEDVPTRQGVEGYSFRIGVLRISDFALRYCGGNRKLTALSLRSMTKQFLTVAVEGHETPIDLEKIHWS